MRFSICWLLAACSVPAVDLEGRQCPCVEGYYCDDLNLCRPGSGDGGPIDSLATTPCLGAIGPELYRYNNGMFEWQHADSSWVGASQIEQTDSSRTNSYAFRTQAELTAGNYRIIAAMRQTASVNMMMSEPSVGIVMRAQLDLQQKDRYTCAWIPKKGELRLEATGSNSLTLASVQVANPNATATVTMEASITGNPPTLSCCLRDYANARLINITDPTSTITAGYPGLGTNRMAAVFPSFAVFAP